MSKENTKRLHLIYGIVLSVLLCVTAVFCVVLCYKIYKTGPSPFTRESVGESFAKVSILVYSLIVLVIGGGIISTLFPLEKEKLKCEINDSLVLHKMSKRLKSVSKEGAAKIEKQRIIRFSMVIISLIVLVIAIVGATVNSIKGYDASSEAVNDQMLKACLTILGYFAAPLIYTTVTVFVCKYSVKKELEIVKNEFKNQKNAEGVVENDLGPITKLTTDLVSNAEEFKKPKKWHRLLSLCISGAILIAAIVFIIVGISNGGMKDVVTKAINICTECIGMG